MKPRPPMSVPLEAKLDAWIEGQPELKPVLSVVEGALLSGVEGPSRSEAVRRLLERALGAG